MDKADSAVPIVFTLADNCYEMQNGQLSDSSGEPLSLRAKSTKVLQVLLKHHGRMVSKDELARIVWPETLPTDESISRCISDIRKVLGDTDHKLLETFPKRGYRINASIGRPLESPPTYPASDEASGSRWRIPTLAVAAIFLSAALLYWFWKAGVETSDPIPRETIAVLPFKNLSTDAPDHLSMGLAENLINELSEISGIRVIPESTSSIHVMDKSSPAELADLLSSRYLVFGEVRQANDQYHIAVQLVDGQDGMAIWAGTYSGSNEVLLNYRDDLMEHIVRELPVTLSEQDRQRLGNRKTNIPLAFEEVLLGRQAISTFTYANSLQAERHFRKAIDLDPQYSFAYAQLAATFAIRLENNWTVLTEADEERAFFYANKSVELDPESWLGHYALGRLHSIVSSKSLDAAETNLKKAISLQPDNDDARVYYAAVKVFQGKQEEAIPIIEAALATHPNPPFWYYLSYGNALFQSKRYADAVEPLNQCLEQLPTAPYCLRFQIANYTQLGQDDDAQWALDEYTVLGYESTLSAMMLAVLNQDHDSRAHIEGAYRAAGLAE